MFAQVSRGLLAHEVLSRPLLDSSLHEPVRSAHRVAEGRCSPVRAEPLLYVWLLVGDRKVDGAQFLTARLLSVERSPSAFPG